MASSIIIVGGAGSDAPGIGIDLTTGKIVPIPGWEADRLTEFASAVSVLETVARFKNQDMAERVMAPLSKFVQGELATMEVGGR